MKKIFVGITLLFILSGCVSFSEKDRIKHFNKRVLQEEIGLKDVDVYVKTMFIDEAGGIQLRINMSNEDRKKLEEDYYTYFKNEKPELKARVDGFSNTFNDDIEGYKDLIDILNIQYTELFGQIETNELIKMRNHIPNISEFDYSPIFNIPDILEPEIYLSVYPNSEETYKKIIKDYPELLKSDGTKRAEWLISNKEFFFFNISINVKNEKQELIKLKDNTLEETINLWSKSDLTPYLNNVEIETYIDSDKSYKDVFNEDGVYDLK